MKGRSFFVLDTRAPRECRLTFWYEGAVLATCISLNRFLPSALTPRSTLDRTSSGFGLASILSSSSTKSDGEGVGGSGSLQRMLGCIISASNESGETETGVQVRWWTSGIGQFGIRHGGRAMEEPHFLSSTAVAERALAIIGQTSISRRRSRYSPARTGES